MIICFYRKKRFLSILLTIYNFFADSDRENVDEENSDKKDFNEENFDEENFDKEN